MTATGSTRTKSTGPCVTGDPNDIFSIQRPFFSSFAPQGRVFFGGGNRTFDAAGNLIPFSTNGADVNGDGIPDGVGATGFDRNKHRTIAVPTDRNLFAALGEYEWRTGHSAYFEGNYARTKTVSELEPFPLDSAQLFPGTGGIIPAQFMVNGALVNNPMIRPDILALLTDRDGDGAVDYNFTKRLSEVGNRGQEAERDTFRMMTGVKGAITGPWNYDAFWSYGVTTESQVGGGQTNVLNFRNALAAIPDGAGGVTCLDPNAVAEGCVPINVFGFNSISPEAAQYIAAPTTFTSETRQNVVGVTVTGEAAQLPAGPLGVAAGIEYRKEFSRSTHDALGQAGLNASNAIPETSGGFDVWDFFLEGRFPIVKDKEWAKMLAATAAVRFGDYSTVGSTFSYSLGLEWALNNDLRFRATNSLATRAPNIAELFQAPSQDFPTGLNDPCDGVTAAHRRYARHALPCRSGRCFERCSERRVHAESGRCPGHQWVRPRQPESKGGGRQVVDAGPRVHTTQHRLAAQHGVHDRLLRHQDRRRDRVNAAPVHPRPVLHG